MKLDNAPYFGGIGITHAATAIRPYTDALTDQAATGASSRVSIQVDGHELELLPDTLKPRSGDTVRFNLTIDPDDNILAMKVDEYLSGKPVPEDESLSEQLIEPRELYRFVNALMAAFGALWGATAPNSASEPVEKLRKLGQAEYRKEEEKGFFLQAPMLDMDPQDDQQLLNDAAGVVARLVTLMKYRA